MVAMAVNANQKMLLGFQEKKIMVCSRAGENGCDGLPERYKSVCM